MAARLLDHLKAPLHRNHVLSVNTSLRPKFLLCVCYLVVIKRLNCLQWGHICHLPCTVTSSLTWCQNSIWANKVNLQSSLLKPHFKAGGKNLPGAGFIKCTTNHQCWCGHRYLTRPSRYLSSIPSYSPASRLDETMHANSLGSLSPSPTAPGHGERRRRSFVSTAQRQGGRGEPG